MSEINCENCKWFNINLIMPDGYCCRYPKHYHVINGKFYYCGEFKERDGE